MGLQNKVVDPELAMMAQGTSNVTQDEQCNFVNRNYNFRPNNNLPLFYHSGLRNYENFSYSNTGNSLNPPAEQGKPVTEKQYQLEELMKTFIVESKARLDQHDKPLEWP